MSAQEILGEAVKTARAEKGWSLTKLGAEAGMSASGVCMVENAQRNLTVTTLVKISRALGTTPSELLRGIE